MNHAGGAAEHFSFGRMVARALGAAALVLVVAVPLVWWLARTVEMVALGVAIGAIVVMLIVMAVVVRRELRHVQHEIDHLKSRRHPES
ncbi:hypothetical protein MUG78_15940 [Gordonia alkaliphila]|uniref:DUF4229 domain-containing protein n=1 Tax=Gordonia alkaliphila TaxID=1053547 RepID=A0ABP8Z6E8_9ACTN|nr:hypothetical protein [Gordonia alkaliphila]MCK0440901.1 hypothetical protein [Gordonia alkaliphila]